MANQNRSDQLVTLRLRRPILKTVLEMFRVAGGRGTIPTFLSEIIESSVADFRVKKITTSANHLERRAGHEINKRQKGHPRVLNEAAIQKLAAMRRGNEVSFVDLARRFAVGQSTVRRALQRHAGKKAN